MLALLYEWFSAYQYYWKIIIAIFANGPNPGAKYPNIVENNAFIIDADVNIPYIRYPANKSIINNNRWNNRYSNSSCCNCKPMGYIVWYRIL